MSSVKVLYWRDDPAATNIANNLREIGLGNLLVQSPKSLLFTTQKELEKMFQEVNDTDYLIVASTHRSETKKPALTVHSTGNFGSADLGGAPNALSYTWPAALKIGLQYFSQNAPEGFDITMEATHHGPTNWEKPLIFIEIGSTEKEWSRKDLGEIVARAIKEIYEKAPSAKFEKYAAFGGTHYCASFNRIQIENEKAAIGHVAARYASEFLNENTVRQAVEKNFAKKAVIDWKGIKSDARNKVLSVLEKLNVPYLTTSDL
ncbi:TPA: hypothetical protein H1005_00175 [archaeon]|uniref:D-aminoacyl-tRNA deacylase n=1 Tax=Candidatus Naiadarchaeum limnaeum TaxID=2756139 RepID=A0A832XLV9_9ARCH|nr:hypothetical protein [Candidatus Naiadarchaeales archaeon SRR2090153.bin1042]HIK00398.1 hypothetical protein [Candidatus Naiadarchaeum limnaeum]